MVDSGFDLLGSDADETRVLVHRATGFASAIPGHPRAITPIAGAQPVLGFVVAMTDAPVELGVRMDSLPTAMQPEALAPSLALAFATSSAAENPELDPRAPVAPGAQGAAAATYRRRGGDDRAMEQLAVAVKQAPTGTFALYQVIRFRRGDVTPVQWANIRTAIASSQTWDARAVPERATSPWPVSQLASPSVALELTERAWAEAQTKAAALGHLDADDVSGLVDTFLTFANSDDPPTFAQHPYLLDLAARQVAGRGPTSATEVLLRNISQVKTTHDLRAWCWQCIWAIGNRSEIKQR